MRPPLLALFYAVSFWSSFTVAMAQTGTVKSEGQPLPGAIVRATTRTSDGASDNTPATRSLTTLTDANGEFKLNGLSPGSWTVDVIMFGFENGHREVIIGSSPSKLDFSLQLAPFPAGFGRGGFDRGGFGRGAAARDGNALNTGANGGGRGGFGQGGFGRRGDIGASNTAALNPTTATETPDITLATPEASQTGQPANTESTAPPADAALAQINASGANESFLVSGSLSAGVQAQPGEFGPGLGGAFGGGPFGDTPNAASSQPQGLPGVQPGGQGPAGGGFGGGGFGGGGFGGRGGGGFGGGFGGRGPGGRGGPAGAGGFIGNRRNAQRNQVRGSIFYTGRNSALDASPFSITGQNGTKAAYAQNQFGFNLGGPLEFPKLFHSQNTFFTINYNGNLSRNGANLVSTVPTVAERGGNFAGLTTIYQPGTSNPFADNQIPLAQINSIAQGLLPFIPLPNQPGTVNNYRLVSAVPNHSQNMNIRVNQTLSRRDQLSFGTNWQTRNSESLQNFGFLDQATGAGIGANVNYRHTFGAGIFQSLTGTFNRNSNMATPFFSNGANVAAQLGIQGTSTNPLNYGPPTLNFTNFGSLTDGSPSQNAVYNVGFAEIFSIRHGKNNWSLGGGYTRYFNNTVTDSNGRGTFTFTGLATSKLNLDGTVVPNTGYDFADFLLGSPQSNSIRYGSSNTYFRSNAYNLFIQDDYRMTANLTLNLGVRYEYFAPWHEKYGRIANLNILPGFTGATVVTPAASGQPAGLIHPDHNNFGPRLALAWKPRSRKSQVVRVGYGIYYNPSVYNQFMSRLSAQPPFAQSTNVIASTANPLTLASGLTVIPISKTILNTFAVNPNYSDLYAQTWNVTVQTSLPRAFVGEVHYMGTKGTHLDILEAPNQAPPGSAATAQLRQPIGNATSFTYETPDANSIYHAIQGRLTRRFRRGISGNLLYTFSKAIDNSATLGGAGNTVAQNFQNLAAERGLSSFDRRQVFTGNFVVSSPVGDAKGILTNRKFITAALKDWTLAPSITAQTGTPLTARVLGNQSDNAGTGVIGSSRAQATGLPIETSSGFFNLAAFTNLIPGPYGNAGRNTIPGPGTFVINLSLQRTIAITERKRFSIRIDANNVTNHVNITGFGTVVNSQNYGVASSAGAMRSISATLRFNF
jgi:hypothetical protein